jgi:hypothetical protein
MDGEIVIGIVAVGAPALAFAYQQLFIHASYQLHKLQKMDESATETKYTETDPAAGKN